MGCKNSKESLICNFGDCKRTKHGDTNWCFLHRCPYERVFNDKVYRCKNPIVSDDIEYCEEHNYVPSIIFNESLYYQRHTL